MDTLKSVTNRSTQHDPEFRMLSDDQVCHIYSASLDILERIGNLVESSRALKLLEDAGCEVTDDNIVRIPSRLVEEAIRTVPKRIVLFDRNGAPVLFCEGRNTYFAPTAGCPYVYDVYTGEKRSWVKKDFEDAARLVDYLPNHDAMFGVGSLGETLGIDMGLHEFDAMVRNTTKPILFLAHDVHDLDAIYRMAAEVVGGWDNMVRRPYLMFFEESAAPLRHMKDPIDKLIYCAERNLPCRYGPNSMSGAGSPVTMAGALAQSFAQALVGLVITQLIRSGSPYMMGLVPGIMDLQTGFLSEAAPEYHLLQPAFAEMCHHFRLPVMTTNGHSDSKIADEQAAIEVTLCTLTAAISGSHISHGTGTLEAGIVGSLELIAMTDEVIGMIRRMLRGVPVDANTLALDVIAEVGPRGNFLGTEHTLANYRVEQWRPAVMDRHSYETWAARGKKTMTQRLNERVRGILETHKPQPLPESVTRRLEQIVREASRATQSV